MAEVSTKASRRQSVERLLKPSWLDLTDCVEPEEICEHLYYHNIIGLNEKEKILAQNTRQRRATELMSVISTRAILEVFKFAKILKTAGVRRYRNSYPSKIKRRYKAQRL